jgi:transposase
MVGGHELTDAQWEKIAPWLPVSGKPGGQWADHRTVINGILFRARTGVPWRDLPERYGSWRTVYERHRRWPADGTWQKILAGLQTGAGATGPAVPWPGALLIPGRAGVVAGPGQRDPHPSTSAQLGRRR